MLVTGVTALVVFYEMSTAISHFTEDTNLFDFSEQSTTRIPYSFTLILVLLGALPIAYLIYKDKGIKLKDAIYEKKSLIGDILFGLLGGVLAALVSLIWFRWHAHGLTISVIKEGALPLSTIILYYIALVLVSGFIKELYYRGLAYIVVKDAIGENVAFLLFNILFGILDWQNLGASFVSGLIWIFLYKKRKHLITPMVAHASVNLITITYSLMFLS